MNCSKHLDFCGIRLVNLSRADFTNCIIESLKKGNRKKICFSLNGQSLSDFHRSPSFRELLSKGDLIHADGMSIVKASKFVSKERLIERIATTDWFHDIAKSTEDTSITHFFLGAKHEVIVQVVSNIRSLYPNLKIAGYHHGYFKNDNEIIELLNFNNPDILWVGLGRPKQEKYAILFKEYTNVGLIKTCGGLFDFLSGKNKRAPLWMHNLGLEWLFRLYLEPKRLFKRYFITNIHSLSIFFLYWLKNINIKRVS